MFIVHHAKRIYLSPLPEKLDILRAIVKYGLIHFTFIVLETCHITDTLQREQYWLDLLESEYNLCKTAGNTQGVYLSEETKTKLRLAHLGKTHSLETRNLMSETRKGTNAYWYGKTHTEVSKAKISAAKQGVLHPQYGKTRPAETIALMRANHPHTKTVFQYASDQITFVAKYDSIRQAATLTGISRGYLSRCLALGMLAHGKWFFTYTAPA
jgi:group I intron endonuclease